MSCITKPETVSQQKEIKSIRDRWYLEKNVDYLYEEQCLPRLRPKREFSTYSKINDMGAYILVDLGNILYF